jgi:hypothetical protein
MTPFGLKLQHRLETEMSRMQNEWFFKWHFIGKDGPVEIDSFDGRMLKYGGVDFSGTTREIYWDTLKRYISNKVDDIFAELEMKLSSYPVEIANQTIDDTLSLLVSFNRRIADIAVEKDKILRGNGFEFPPLEPGTASKVLQASNITLRASALKTLVKLKQAAVGIKTVRDAPQTDGNDGSFRDFKDQLLVAIAIEAKAEPTSQLTPSDVAAARALSYRNGWLRQAVKSLENLGYIDARYYLGGGEDGGMMVQITGSGLEVAEELCNRSGIDLYQEVDELNQIKSPSTNFGVEIPASDRIVLLDHNSDPIKSIQEKVVEVFDAAKSSNSLSANNLNEAEQNIAELKAGHEIIKAHQAEIGLIQRLIVKPLKWLLSTVADTSLKELIKYLLGLIFKLFGPI